VARKVPAQRVIKFTSIQIGDTIKVEGKYLDMNIHRNGKVAKRDLRFGFEYTTEHGGILLTVHHDGTTDPVDAKVTLLHRNIAPTLF